VIPDEKQFSLNKSGSENRAVAVLIHPNQFPHAVEAAFRESLRTRRMNHKFHYAASVARVVPQYDNALTRDWLLSVLLDLGVERDHGCLEFRVAPCPAGSGLLRIEADFVFVTAVKVNFGGTAWRFAAGDRFQLFYSYRHTLASVASLLGPHGIQISRSWTNATGEEGVFLGHRT
jgi:hypothetical protein